MGRCPYHSHSGCATAAAAVTFGTTLLRAAKRERNKTDSGQGEQVPGRFEEISNGAIPTAEVWTHCNGLTVSHPYPLGLSELGGRLSLALSPSWAGYYASQSDFAPFPGDPASSPDTFAMSPCVVPCSSRILQRGVSSDMSMDDSLPEA